MHRRALAGQTRCGSPEAGFDSDLEEEDQGQQQPNEHDACANQVSKPFACMQCAMTNMVEGHFEWTSTASLQPRS